MKTKLDNTTKNINKVVPSSSGGETAFFSSTKKKVTKLYLDSTTSENKKLKKNIFKVKPSSSGGEPAFFIFY